MMDGMADDELFGDLADLGTQESAAPPLRHAVPAKHLPPLEPGTLVTIGRASWWWAIDELRVRSGPHEGAEGFYYLLEPLPEPGAGAIRERSDDAPPWAAKVYARYTHINDIWVYRDDVAERSRDEIAPPDPRDTAAWLARLNDITTPPPVLRPYPARDVPCLPGRRVRVATTSGGWMWAVCVTEPVQFAGADDIVVGVVTLGDYWQLVYDTAQPGRRHVIYPQIHTVWCY